MGQLAADMRSGDVGNISVTPPFKCGDPVDTMYWKDSALMFQYVVLFIFYKILVSLCRQVSLDGMK